GRVEREVSRLELVDGEPVIWAAVALAVAALLECRLSVVARRRGDQDDPLPQPERRLDRVRKSCGVGVGDRATRLAIDRPAVRPALGALRRLGMPHDVAVDDDLDAVALVLVERRRVTQVHDLAVHPNPDEALLAGRLEDPVALGLAVLDERPEDEKP